MALVATCLALAVGSPVGGTAASVDCPPTSFRCTVKVSKPDGPAAPTTPPIEREPVGAERKCILPVSKQEVPCTSPEYGWFSHRDGCYYKLDTEREYPPDNPAWAGHHPDGAIYWVSCFDTQAFGTRGGPAWLADPPWGVEPQPDPRELARTAVDSMRLTGPDIHTSLPQGKLGLVLTELWLWTPASETTWGPNTATASVPGLEVTATARAQKIVWNMGDGTSVTCTTPGSPYVEGRTSSPGCGHTYERSSLGMPDDAYPITATTTWVVDWSGGGSSGTLTVTRESSTSVRIGELQVLVS